MRMFKTLLAAALCVFAPVPFAAPAQAADLISVKLQLFGPFTSTATLYLGPQRANGSYEIVGANDWVISDPQDNGGASRIVNGLTMYRKNNPESVLFYYPNNSAYADHFDTDSDGFSFTTEYVDSNGTFVAGNDYHVWSNGQQQECFGNPPVCGTRLDPRYVSTNMPGGYNPSGFTIGARLTDPVYGTLPGVPEPAQWALMITGFGLVGFAARRRALLSSTRMLVPSQS